MKSLTGILVSSGENQNRQQVDLAFHGCNLNISADISNLLLLSLPISSLDFHLGGSNLLFITSNSLGENTLYVEASAENFRQLEAAAEIGKKLAAIKKQRKISALQTTVWLSLAIGIFAGLVLFRGPIFGGLGTLFPFSWEKKIADEVFNPKLTREQMELTQKLAELVAYLKMDEKSWPEKFVVHISSDKELNAYATLGGHLFITRGLIEELDRPEQLLGVLAHEMVHVQKRHVVRLVFQGLGLFTVFQLILGDVSGLVAIAVDQGGPLFNLQYSRTLEAEADQLGIRLLIQNQIDPRGLPESLKLMSDHQKTILKQTPGGETLEKIGDIEFISSHPELEKRIHSLQQITEIGAAEMKIKKIEFDYVNFKQRVKEVF